MAQMKEQIKPSEKELNEMEISNLSDAEFKTLFIRMLKELSEGLSSIKKIQSETKDTLTEIKNNLQAVSYTHLTLPTIGMLCRSRWSPYH